MGICKEEGKGERGAKETKKVLLVHFGAYSDRGYGMRTLFMYSKGGKSTDSRSKLSGGFSGIKQRVLLRGQGVYSEKDMKDRFKDGVDKLDI